MWLKGSELHSGGFAHDCVHLKTHKNYYNLSVNTKQFCLVLKAVWLCGPVSQCLEKASEEAELYKWCVHMECSPRTYSSTSSERPMPYRVV